MGQRSGSAAGAKVAVIPGGMTMHLQSIDTDFASTYKRIHHALYCRYVNEHNGVMPDAQTQRQLLVDWTFEATKEATGSIDVPEVFARLGYIQTAGQPIGLRDIPEYSYIPATEAPPIDTQATPAARPPKSKPRQATMERMFEKVRERNTQLATAESNLID